ncbi:MAG: ABC transporter permease [Mycobacteriaceae bacterium]|uniref:ABC transporter permease n=1 Tax=Corynebacterium sp. TaxID=1720 RepID=UPI003F9CB458
MSETSQKPSGEDRVGKDDPDAAAKAAKRERAEKIGCYVAMFAMPLIMVGMMVWGYLYAMHSPTPHDMPVTVATETTSQTAEASAEALSQGLDAAGDDTVDVQSAGSADEARQQVIDRDVAAAVVVGDDGATLYTAGGAGAQQASTVQQVVGPVAAATDLQMDNEDLVPLPDSDPAGLGAMFMTTALLLAGFLPLTITLTNSPQLLLLKRRAIPLIAGWAAVIATIVWFVAGPCLHVVDSSDAWQVLGIAWLAVFAVGSVQMFLTRIFGPMSVIVGMFLLMVLGIPASNVSIPIFSTPGLYHVLHSFLPAPAIGEALRSVLYFDGEGAWSHLWVLIIGAAAGILLTSLIDANKSRKGKRPKTMVVNLPSLHGGERPKSRFWQYAALAFFPLAMVLMMVVGMLGAMHNPAPRDMPVAVAAETSEQAEQTVDGLSDAMPGSFEFTVVDSADEVRTQVEDRDVAGGFILPSADNPSATVVTNQAGGSSTAQAIEQAFTQIAQAQDMPVETDDITPLPDRDSLGTVSLYLAIGWMMAGFMVILVGSNAQPASRPLRRLIPIVAGYAVFMSFVVWLIASPIVGAVGPGHFLPLWGVGIVAIFSVAMFAAVLERLFGLLGVIPIVGVVMFLGIPASGGALSIYMEPALFTHLHGVLPMAASVESARSILYFDSDIVGQCLRTFAIWGVVSLVLVMIIDRFKPLRTTTPHHVERIWGSDDDDEDDESGADSSAGGGDGEKAGSPA